MAWNREHYPCTLLPGKLIIWIFQDFYSEINAATLTGAIDVIVVQQEDGSYKCSPFHVRFGKLGVLKAREKIVRISCETLLVFTHLSLSGGC